MNIAFFGTPEFAVPSLKKIIESHHKISVVITQPSKPVGRKQILTPPPVKEIALSYNLKILQPEKVSDKNFLDEYKKCPIDLNLIIAYGQILPDELIYFPKFHSVNIHASLLPKYRGASPINWAIINGDKETGITYQFIEKKLDAGDIIYQEKIKIDETDSSITLTEKLSNLSSETVLKVLEMIESQNFTKIKQDEAKATYVKILKKEDGKIDFNESAEKIVNKIRGLLPWPGAFCFFDNKIIKIYKAKVIPSNKGNIGEVIEIIKGIGFVVKAKENAVLICEVQPESGKLMNAYNFAIGHKDLLEKKFL